MIQALSAAVAGAGKPALSLALHMPKSHPVGADNPVTSRGLGVFTDQSAEPISPQHADIRAYRGRMRASSGRVLLQRPMRPMRVVVIYVLVEDQLQMPLAGDHHPVQALAASAAHPALRDRVAPHRQLHLIRWIGTDASG